jgi:hypothetical protein
MNTVTDRMLPACIRDYLREIPKLDSTRQQVYLTQLCRTYGHNQVHHEIDKQLGVA